MSSDKNKYRYRQEITEPMLLDGKLPPQAIELEEVVLGACLLEAKECFSTVNEILNPECFYKESHKKIFEAMISLNAKNNPIDILTVTKELRTLGALDVAGGGYYVSGLTNTVSSSANTEYHCRIVLQKYMARELIRSSTLSIQAAYNDETDIIDELELSEKRIGAISQSISSDGTQIISDVANQELKRIIENVGKSQISGIPFPIKELNEQTGGMQEGEMIILAGRPAQGKSAFALDVLVNAANNGFPCAMFNLEMMNKETMQRLISKKTYIQIRDLKSLNLTERDIWEISQATKTFQNMPIYLSDEPISTISTLRRSAKKLVREKGVKLIILDYLQLMSDKSPGRNRENEVSEISRGIKLLAKELKIPILALSQLSREVEKTSNKRPMLSHLRESGSLEQESDIVLFVYRPETYQIDNIELDSGETYTSTNKAVIDIGKNRNGGLKQICVNFHKSTTTFSDLQSLNDLPEKSINQFNHRSNEF